MPDRPRNGGPEDGPDFTWLYGEGGKPKDPQATRPVPRQQRPSAPRPDETRVMTCPAAGPAPGAPHDASDPASARAARQPPAAGQGRGRKRRRFRARYVLIILLLWLAYLVIVPVMAWRDVDKVAWEPEGDRPADQPGHTYLMVGSDSRAGLSKEERKALSTGGRRRRPHRHDHAAAHRLRPEPAALHPS